MNEAKDLHRACSTNDLEWAKSILSSAKVSINTCDHRGRTVLELAAKNGFSDLVELFVKTGAEDMDPALLAASYKGHYEIARFLVESGANINAVPKKDRTALSAASYEGHYEIARFLVESGANVNAFSRSRTPLIEASYGGNYEIVRFLVESGADINAALEGRTALSAASSGVL